MKNIKTFNEFSLIREYKKNIQINKIIMIQYENMKILL